MSAPSSSYPSNGIPPFASLMSIVLGQARRKPPERRPEPRKRPASEG